MRKSIQDLKTGFSKEIKLVKTNQTEVVQKMQTHLDRLIAWWKPPSSMNEVWGGGSIKLEDRVEELDHSLRTWENSETP